MSFSINFENWFHRKLDKVLGRKSYKKLQYCIQSPIELMSRLNQLETPVKGFDLYWAFRMHGIDMRFGKAKLRGENKQIILIDIKTSGYERWSGRYIAYTLTEVRNELYSVNNVYYGSRRLPNGWVECFDSSKYHFI